MNTTVLIIEDEERIRRVIKDYLLKEGYRVLEANNGRDGLKVFYENHVDLIILDIMLPYMNGFEVCKKIRENSHVLILMLTAKSEEDDNLLGYELGADDYITKPFRVKILIAKIKALLKRSAEKINNGSVEDYYIYGDMKVDLNAKKLFLHNKEIPLTNKEYHLLVYFIYNANMALSRNQILDGVWGKDYYGAQRTVDACIKRLRAKVGEKNIPIVAVRGYGYRFEVAL